MTTPRSELFDLLLRQSVCFGEFILKSGAWSNFYIDCRQTALDARGAVLTEDHAPLDDAGDRVDVDDWLREHS